LQILPMLHPLVKFFTIFFWTIFLHWHSFSTY
jgi:hypothetical protein